MPKPPGAAIPQLPHLPTHHQRALSTGWTTAERARQWSRARGEMRIVSPDFADSRMISADFLLFLILVSPDLRAAVR